MKNLISEIVRELINESVNINDQNILSFGKASKKSDIILKDDYLHEKSITLNETIKITNNVSIEFTLDKDTKEINIKETSKPIPAGDLRIKSFGLYNSNSIDGSNPKAAGFKILDIAKIMKNQFDLVDFKNKFPVHANLQIEENPEYSAAKDFLENELIKEKIEEFKPDIFLFPQSSSLFNQILRDMLTQMYPNVEVLSSIKQTMLTSFDDKNAALELKRAKLKQAIQDPTEFATNTPNIQKQGFEDINTLKSVNIEIFQTIKEIIETTLDNGPAVSMPAAKIHEVNSLSQMQGWRTYITNMHNICYDKSKFPIKEINIGNNKIVDVQKIMWSIAFCYGMILFYYAANSISPSTAEDEIENTNKIKANSIQSLEVQLADLGSAIEEIELEIEYEEDPERIKSLKNQLSVLQRQYNQIENFTKNQNALVVNNSNPQLSHLENIISAIKDHVKTVYEGLIITEDDLVNVKSIEEIFIKCFEKIIERIDTNDKTKGLFSKRTGELISPKEMSTIIASLSVTIKKFKSDNIRNKPDVDNITSFNRNSRIISQMLNTFLVKNIAKSIVSNMEQVQFPIKIEKLTKDLIKDPLKILKNGKVQIEDNVYCEVDSNGDLIISGRHQDIEAGENFEIRVFKFILDKIIVVDSKILEKLIEESFTNQLAIFKSTLNSMNMSNVPTMKRILIVDDNIATGATLAMISRKINEFISSYEKINLDVEEVQTRGTVNFRSINRELFKNLEKTGKDIGQMKDVIEKSNIQPMIIDAVLKNIICISPAFL